MVRPLVDLGAKVVMVTAETDRARHAECVAAGAIGIVSKTVSFDRLVEVVLDAVAGRPLMTSAEREDLLADLRQRRAEESRSEEHTSELQSLMRISYAVFCLKKKK